MRVFLLVMKTVFPMFARIATRFAEVQMPDKGCQGHLEFRLATGNAGTGMCQRGAFEHGCEFAPVAGKNNILIKIFSAAYNFYVAFLFEELCRLVNEYQKEYIDRPKERSESGNNVRTGISDFPSRASENAACK